MTVAVLFFSAMTILIRMLSNAIPIHEMIFVRGVISVAILMPWFFRQGLQALATRRFPLLMGRATLTSIGLVAWIYALARLPLADAVALHFTLPLFGVVLALIFLREKISTHRWIATLVGFAGVLVILRPGVGTFDVVSLIVLLSALAYAGTGIVTKILVRTESSAAIVFYVSAFTAVVFAIPSLFDWVQPTIEQWAMLIAIGLFNVAGQSFLNKALSLGDASFILPFDFLRLPFAAAAGFLLFAETPDIWTLIGALIIFAATSYATWRERQA
jgi:drug/metabolite transporter (DMT)-like permease